MPPYIAPDPINVTSAEWNHCAFLNGALCDLEDFLAYAIISAGIGVIGGYMVE